MTLAAGQALVHEFRFYATLPAVLRVARSLPLRTPFSLWMTQDEFEDHQFLTARAYQEFERLGWADFRPAWFEAPPVAPALLARIAAALGYASDRLIPKYPHSWHFKHYNRLVVDDIEFRHMAYSAHHFVKVAPHPGPWPAVTGTSDTGAGTAAGTA